MTIDLDYKKIVDAWVKSMGLQNDKTLLNLLSVYTEELMMNIKESKTVKPITKRRKNANTKI